jgi:hypothetical protein
LLSFFDVSDVQSSVELCRIEGCPNPRRKPRGTVCETHHKRKVRHHSMQEDVEVKAHAAPLKRLLLSAAIRLADLRATDDEGWRRAWHQLRMAARRYVLGVHGVRYGVRYPNRRSSFDAR